VSAQPDGAESSDDEKCSLLRLVMTSRPRGRRYVDLAGPFVRDLPEGTQAQESVAAVAAARELPRLSLEDAPELTSSLAKTRAGHPRVAARWLLRTSKRIPR